MVRTYLLAVAALGMMMLAGCSGGEIPIDTAQLQAPVNVTSVSIVTQDQQVAASEALGRIGTPAVQPLSQALSDAEPSVRIEACRALAYMGAKAKEAVPPLTQALTDPEDSVRVEAARALGQVGEQAQLAVPELMQMLHKKKPVER